MIKSELYRKIFHVFSIVIPIIYYFFLHSRKIALIILLPIALISIIVDIIRIEHPTVRKIFYRIFGVMLRNKEISKLTGASYLLTSSVICIAVFPIEITFLALSFLSIGDTFASLVGIPFGKREVVKYNKTIEGGLACFLSNFVFGIISYYLIFSKAPSELYLKIGQLYLVMIFTGAVSSAIAEFINIPINDNIRIPLFSGIVMSLTFMLIP